MAVTTEQAPNLSTHRILSSTKISPLVTKILSTLTQQTHDQGNEKPALLRLTAHPKASAKLITIVEISKRQLALTGTSCYQYTALSSQLIDIPRQKPSTNNTAGSTRAEPDSDPEDPDDVAFEIMPPPGGQTKKRSVPVLSIYLSARPVREWRIEYG
ncbi:hypothetical protein LTR62_005612 [Meristemomyces frigidus]|uniref:DNA/RNA-binding protein Alba-like domain-containing protein n=1 Tax=Meristemomyces frigidus TaxID=1508187 RepID=A0AAN7TEC1_9PEZI|nr:hypothetical protein LTR62_005612 [Meristemomyces frigidus]